MEGRPEPKSLLRRLPRRECLEYCIEGGMDHLRTRVLASGPGRENLAITPGAGPALKEPDHMAGDVDQPTAVLDMRSRIVFHVQGW